MRISQPYIIEDDFSWELFWNMGSLEHESYRELSFLRVDKSDFPPPYRSVRTTESYGSLASDMSRMYIFLGGLVERGEVEWTLLTVYPKETVGYSLEHWLYLVDTLYVMF